MPPLASPAERLHWPSDRIVAWQLERLRDSLARAKFILFIQLVQPKNGWIEESVCRPANGGDVQRDHAPKDYQK